MPSKHGLQCALYLVRIPTRLESLYCTMVVSASKGTKAFVQEYAKISGRKSDKDSRKAVMDHRYITRSTRTTPRQQIIEAFIPGEFQQPLSRLKVGKVAGPDGIVPDLLKQLSMKGSSVLLSILNSSWLSSWCTQSWRSAYVVLFLKKRKGPSRRGKLMPNSAEFDDREGLGKTH